jgi:capsular exopolysaccharide synthesis family protein
MNNQTTESFITISDLYRLCIARWRWFVVIISVALFLAVCYLIKIPFLYTRKAVVMVREESLGKNTTEKNGNEFNDIGFVKQKSSVTNVIRQYKSLGVLMEVAHRLDSTLKDGYLVYKAEAIQSRLEAENDDLNSTVIDITYRDYSTKEAERVLNLILQVYNEKWLEDKRRATLHTSQFIDSRLKLLEQDLGIVDDSIAQFKSRYGITDLEHVSDLYLQQQNSSDTEILKLTNQRAMAEFIRGMLENESSEPQLLLVNSGIDNNVLESQISLYNNLLMQLQSHQNYTSSQNPLILNQEEELDRLRKRILDNIKSHIHTIDIQLNSLIDYYDEATSKVVSNPAQAKYLATIERERKVKESLYMFLLQKKEENEIGITYNSYNTIIIEKPHGSGKPTSPKRINVLLAALFLGILGPVTVIFLRASFDDSVRDRHDVERNCDIPFLGEVPYSGHDDGIDNLLKRIGLGNKTKSSGIVVGHDLLNASNEAFRVLRNNMDASFAGNFLNEGGKSYLIKSTQIEVGKTYVAMNLALVRAIGGERVLFIDGDLRQASASRLWGAPLLGLTDLLNGDEEDYRKLLFHPENYPMLDVLPAGALPTNPTELLKSPLLDQFLMTAKEHYDCIIIDSPTSGMLADADIIERAVDCTMFVIRAGRFNRHQLNEISQIQATNSESKLQYVILNGVSVNARYGYTYLHKYERSEADKSTVEISKKTILLDKIIFKKKKT